jgi:hypothetical protein
VNNEVPFQLMAWIKRQHAEAAEHATKMAVKNYSEDLHYMRLISFLIRDWRLLKIKERQLVMNFAKWHQEYRCFTVGQRSCITGMCYKYCPSAF